MTVNSPEAAKAWLTSEQGSGSVSFAVAIPNGRMKKVSVWKTDLSYRPLTGAAFILYKAEDYDDSAEKPLNGAVPVVVKTSVGSDGILYLGELPLGSCRLVETEAPAGYNLNPGAVKIEVGETDVKAWQAGKPAEVFCQGSEHWVNGQDEAVWQVRVWNNPGVALPSTGASVTRARLTLASMASVMAGAVLTLAVRRRKEEEE